MFTVAMIAILVSMALLIAKTFFTRTVFGRILLISSFGTKTVLLIAVLGFLAGRPDFLDLALVYALMNFIGTIGVLRFTRYGDLANMDRQRGVVVDMDKVSHWPEDWTGYTHVQVETWYVRNGHYGAFNQGLNRVSKALKAGGYPGHWGFSRVVSGGHGNQIDLILPVKGWAGMAEKKPSFYDIMVEELGGDEAFQKFMTGWGETFKVGHNEMLEWMPGASDYGDE